jgi:hypothetical protein
MTSRFDATEQALKELRKLLEGGKRPGENRITIPVDTITVKGTDEQVVMALQEVPKHYKFARMLLLRRLWQLGDGFIKSDRFIEHFASLVPLRNDEYNKMARQFSQKAATIFVTRALKCHNKQIAEVRSRAAKKKRKKKAA